MIEAKNTSKKLVSFYQNTRYSIPEEKHSHALRREILIYRQLSPVTEIRISKCEVRRIQMPSVVR